MQSVSVTAYFDASTVGSGPCTCSFSSHRAILNQPFLIVLSLTLSFADKQHHVAPRVIQCIRHPILFPVLRICPLLELLV